MRTRSARLVPVLVASLILAGCSVAPLGEGPERSVELEPVDVPDTDRDGDELWMVWVRSNETVEGRNQPVCARTSPSYELLHANQSVRYDPARYDFEPDEVEVLLAFRHEDRSSSCPEAYRLVANPDRSDGEDLGGYGTLEVTVDPDGSLAADGHEVGLGQAARFTYEGAPADANEGRVDGAFRVVNLGAWDREALWAKAPG